MPTDKTLLLLVLLAFSTGGNAEQALADEQSTAGTTPAATVAIVSIDEAINQAGRQRMLTQRIVKCYAQMGQDVRYLDAGEQLAESIAMFERQLAGLNGFARDPESQHLIGQLEQRWRPMYEIATAENSRARARTLRYLAEQALATAHQLVLLLEHRSGTEQSRLVNLAGRQRMLSQRLANLYLLLAWDLGDPQYLSDYRQAVREFDGALYELSTAGENTPQLTRALQEVAAMWQMFRFSDRIEQGEYVPSLSTRMLDKILLRMDEITGMYVELQSE